MVGPVAGKKGDEPMAHIYKPKGRETGKWVITYYPRPGLRKSVTGCMDRQATEVMANDLEKKAALVRHGLIDDKAERYASEAEKSLEQHLADFKMDLEARDVTRQEVSGIPARVHRVIDLAKATRIAGLKPSDVNRAVKDLRDGGLSLETCNHYLRAVKQFSRWLWRDGRAREDNLAFLKGYNVAKDRRHDRRALGDDELERLVEAAEAGPVVLGMTGPDRAVLYRLAAGTGFRAGELRSLTPECFALDAEPPRITIKAGYSKRRRQDEQPIRRDLADSLTPWLEGKVAGKPVFKLTARTAEMIRADLAAARQTWLDQARTRDERAEREESSFLAYRDAEEKIADFHALRHTFITRLGRSGVGVKVVQDLARHSTPALTLGVYTHLDIHDRVAALEALPATGQKAKTARPKRRSVGA